MKNSLFSNNIAFNSSIPGFLETYYVNWTDPDTDTSMMLRYVLVNGPTEESQIAEIWVWYWNKAQGIDFAYRQQYPLGQALWNNEGFKVKIGNSNGFEDNKVWGRVLADGNDIQWNYELDISEAVPVNRAPGTEHLDFFFQFRSHGCLSRLNGSVTVNGVVQELSNLRATDGHYYNIGHLQNWSWASAFRFEEEEKAMYEGIGFQLYSPNAPRQLYTAVFHDGTIKQNDCLTSVFKNHETVNELERWCSESEMDGQLYKAEVTGKAEDMILILHPLPDGNFLYTTICPRASMEIQIFDLSNKTVPVKTLKSLNCVHFEVTKPIRNENVCRDFAVVLADSKLMNSTVHCS